jgi:hypothetical protein
MSRILHAEHEDPAVVEQYLKAKEAYFVPTHKRGAYSSRVLPMHAHEVETKISPLGNAVPKEAPPMSWHEFHKIGKGGTLFTLGGDRSNLGRLTHINGEKLAWPVDLHAGTKYMTEPNEGAVWANAKGAATALQNNIREAAKKGPVYGVFAPMGPTAVDSSVNMFDALMAQVPKAKISDKDANAFDASLKAGAHIKGAKDEDVKKREIAKQIMENWPGIRNAKKALEFGKTLSGAHRAAIVKHLEAAPFQKAGFPSVGMTRAAITDPEMLDVAGNMMGHHLVELHEGEYDPQNLAFEHSTYGVPTKGKFIGKLPLIERQIAQPDFAEQQMMDKAVVKATGEPLIIHPYSPNPQGRSSFRNAVELRQGIQPINDRMLESIEQAHGSSFAHGGNVEPVHITHKYSGNPYFHPEHFREGGDVDQDQGNLTAYHGSPHNFEQFKTSQIGTGEGAQSFGHGLYFAQNEDVAKNYRDKLAGQDTYMIDHILEHAPELKNADRDTQMDLHKWAMNEKHDPYSAAKWAQAGNSRLREFDQNRIANVLASYRNASRGHMYEVGIKAHPNDFLDWDDYKANQSNKVHRAVSKLIEDKINKENPSNEDKYRYLSPTLKGREIYSLIHQDPQEASKLLHAHGIKGIKYLDELSRFKDDDDEDKTYNYVVFDDKDVHVRRKYAHGGDVERKHYEEGGGTDGGGGGGTDAGGFGAGVGGNDAGAQGMGSGDGPGGGGGGGDSGPSPIPEAVAQQPEEKKPDPIAPKPLTPENMGLNLGYTGTLKPTITGAMPTPYAEGGIVDAALRKINSKYSPEGLPLSAMEILSKIARTG